MSIRNRDNIIRIFSATDIGESNPYIEFESLFTDIEYYCVYFVGSEVLSTVKNYIPDDILDEIKHNDLHLLLSNNLEGMHDIAIHVSKFAEDMQIPKDKITLLTSAYDIISSDIKTVITDAFEWAQLHRLTNSKTKREYKKRFIYPNHRWRLHRPALVAMLAHRDLLKHGYVSLRVADDNRSWNEFSEIIANKYPELKNFDTNTIPDLFIDNVEFNVGYPDELAKSFYEESCFSIVSETNYYHPESRFFSEKTYKNIEYEMPFILVSRPYSLSLLRDKGYKTFSPYINEEYDLEEDDDKRLVMIADEIERLCNLPEQELLEITKQLEPICKYNRQVLVNKKYPDDFIWHTL